MCLCFWQDDCFNECVRFGNFATDGDDLMYDPPADENAYYFDFTSCLGYSKDAFSEDIRKSMDSGDLSYLFASYDVDIACPDSVLKDCSKELLSQISFGGLSLQTIVCFCHSCAIKLNLKKLKWGAVHVFYSLKHPNIKLWVTYKSKLILCCGLCEGYAFRA